MKYNHDYTLVTKSNLSKRIVAGLIDYIIIFGYFYIVIHFYGEPNEEGGYPVNGLPAFSIMLFWLFMTVGLEQIIGATVGNKLLSLRPIPKMDPRRKLTFSQSLKRHLLDMVDVQLLGLLAILTIKNTEYNQRLGDLWAKTIVIDETDKEQGLKNKELLPT